MSDYIKTKEYKFPDGETVTAYFDEYGIAKITIQALDAIFDIFINSADRIEVVRCKDCKYGKKDSLFVGGYECSIFDNSNVEADDFCSYGKKRDD